MFSLNSLELSTAKEIINIGLAKAADSLSFFMKEKILIRSIDFEIKEIASIQGISSLKGDKCYVLTTRLIGELKGICYLVFSEEEKERIYKLSLPETITSSPEKMREMGPAILLEIDNILAASVITQFANLLRYKIHGGVPDLKEMQSADFRNFILQNSDKQDLVLSFKAEFIASGQNFNPQFFWILDNNFFEGVKSFLNSSENIEKLRELCSRTTIIA
jgi:chemotaxis protein CheY-P-specific phosphatase CheC